jgi:hypothetical protein
VPARISRHITINQIPSRQMHATGSLQSCHCVQNNVALQSRIKIVWFANAKNSMPMLRVSVIIPVLTNAVRIKANASCILFSMIKVTAGSDRGVPAIKSPAP